MHSNATKIICIVGDTRPMNGAACFRFDRGKKLFGNPEHLMTQTAIASRARLTTIDFFILEIGAVRRAGRLTMPAKPRRG